MRKIILMILIATLVLAAGCEREIDSRTPLRSLPDPLSAPFNVSVELADRAVTLYWEMTDSSEVSRFRVYQAEADTATYILRDSTADYTITIEDLSVNKVYLFRIAAVDGNHIEGTRSAPVTTLVGLMQLTINDDDEYTDDRNVQLRLSTTNTATHMILSEDSLFTDGNYQPFSAVAGFTLSDGDGRKMVYAGFLFSNGSRSAVPVSDEIILDSRTEIDSVFFLPDQTSFVTGEMITFGLDAGDYGLDEVELDGTAYVYLSEVDSVRLYDNGTGGDAVADDGIYTADYILPDGMALGNVQVTGRFIDAAGNVDTRTGDKTLTVVSFPTPVQIITVEAVSSSEISLTWTEAVDEDFASYRVYRDTDNNPPESPEMLVATITSRSILSFTDTALDGSTWYYYRVFVRNVLSQSSGSNVDSARTMVNEPPVPVVLAGTLSDSTTVRLTWSRNADSDFASYRIYRSTSAIPEPPLESQMFAFINEQSTTLYNDYVSASGTYHYIIYVYDRQGETAGSNEVVVTR
ncbi:MAG: fibronectin type III domain-containing protein [Candidatus Zixiibacteriota bacterium]